MEGVIFLLFNEERFLLKRFKRFELVGLVDGIGILRDGRFERMDRLKDPKERLAFFKPLNLKRHGLRDERLNMGVGLRELQITGDKGFA